MILADKYSCKSVQQDSNHWDLFLCPNVYTFIQFLPCAFEASKTVQITQYHYKITRNKNNAGSKTTV